MRIALTSFPIERIGETYQSTVAYARKNTRVHHIEIPNGHVAFLYTAGINTNLPYKLIIDNEEINEKIGSIDHPTVFNPPYIAKKNISIYVENNSDIDKTIQTYINGIVYEELTLQPIEDKLELREIKEKLGKIEKIKEQEQTVGVVFDKKINVTDKIKMLYDDENKGLNWTAVDITNMGPDPVYYCVNKWKSPEAPLHTNMTASIDLGRKNAIKKIYFVCDKGETATVYLRILK